MAGKQQGVKQTPQQRAQAEVAVQQLQDFKQRWMPVQQQMVQTINDMGARDSAPRQQARGMAATDTAAQFGDAQQKLQQQTASAGLMGSTKQKLGIAGLGDDAAISSGMGIVGADQRVDDAYLQGLGQVMALGRGEKATAMQGLSSMARISGQQAASDAQMALQRRAGDAQIAGQALGLGLSGALGGMGTGNAFNGTNDFGGVNGGNAMNTWGQFGSSGD